VKKLSKYERDELDRKQGPEYKIGSAQLVKFRQTAKRAGGVMKLDRFARVQYANEVERAVLAAQRAQLKSHGEPQCRPMCASGTWHSDGNKIGAAIRARYHAALLAFPAQERRTRSPQQWLEMYDAAMLDKREREKQARFAGYLNQGKEAA
jgi:hypothetical protein